MFLEFALCRNTGPSCYSCLEKSLLAGVVSQILNASTSDRRRNIPVSVVLKLPWTMVALFPIVFPDISRKSAILSQCLLQNCAVRCRYEDVKMRVATQPQMFAYQAVSVRSKASNNSWRCFTVAVCLAFWTRLIIGWLHIGGFVSAQRL